jgi:non-ribosomal peptide synthetase component E (peptide arylation enzyme)
MINEVDSKQTLRVGVARPIPGVVYPPLEELQRYVAAGALDHSTFPGVLRETFQRHGPRKALVGAQGDVSYERLDEISERLAAALLELGLRPLDRVIFQLPNSNELVYCFVACLKAGLIPVCTLAAHREQEIGYLARHSKATGHIVLGDDPKFDAVNFAEAMQKVAPTLKHIIQLRGVAKSTTHTLEQLLDSMPLARAKQIVASVEHDPFQVAVFQLSGGTTGVPKIIPRFHNEYIYNMRAVAAWNHYDKNDVFCIPLPMIHNFNMCCIWGPALLVGASNAIAPNIQPKTLIGLFRKYKPTWTGLPGPAASRMVWLRRLGIVNFKRAHGLISMSGSEKISKLMKAPAYHVFGITEGIIMFTRAEDPEIVRNVSVGRPVSPFDQVRILKPGTDEDVLPGEVGESAFKGPYTIHGYYDAPERDRETFTHDGYYRSGDLMREMTVGGIVYYVFAGRIKSVVDRAGEKINCEEVEQAVMQHPSVAEAVVIGVPDPDYGERACAIIVPAPFKTAPTVEQLGTFLKDFGIAKFKWPEHVRVVKELPVTKVGKLDRIALKNEFAKHFK